MNDAPNAKLTAAVIQKAIKEGAVAFRTRNRLQPAEGTGGKVFPPTYSGAVYATETRRVDGADVTCVLLDSVQSQANRHEEALQNAIDAGLLSLPLVEVDFSKEELLDAVGVITSLTAPHRIADAILRDSELDGIAFRKTKEGESLDFVSLQNATPLYNLCPTALVFGLWDSTGPKGGLGAKFQRAFVSEIVGVMASFGVKTSSRIDPLQIRATAMVVKGNDGSYSIAENDKTKGAIKPSEINHGNVTPGFGKTNEGQKIGGVTLDYAEQTAVLSLPALRRLHFPVDGEQSTDRDIAGQTVLAAIALTSAALAYESGYDLRSRCLLWPEHVAEWEVLETPGNPPTKIKIPAKDAMQALNDAVAAAEAVGLKWRTEKLVLKPSASLAALVKRSQKIATTTPTED